MAAPEASDLQGRVDELDVSLLGEIESQTTFGDRRSLLALHAACRSAHGRFTYLEIGSHRGGSLQALIRDPLCERVISIDARPRSQPDERGRDYVYEANSTESMLRMLSGLPGADTGKIETLEAGTEALDPASLAAHPALCFIDGEHTDAAAQRDARFCRTLIEDCGAIAFHDAQIVYGGIERFLEELRAEEVPVHPYVLPDSMFVVELGEPVLSRTRWVEDLVGQGWRSFLFALRFNDGYRRGMNSPLARALRRLRLLKVQGIDDVPPSA